MCREVCGTQEVCGLCQEVCGLELTTRPDVWPDKGGPRLEERDGNSSSCPCLCVPVHGGPSPGCEPTEAGREGPVQVVPATGMCRPAGSIAGHCKGCDGADRLRAREACVMQRRATLALFSLSLAPSLPPSLALQVSVSLNLTRSQMPRSAAPPVMSRRSRHVPVTSPANGRPYLRCSDRRPWAADTPWSSGTIMIIITIIIYNALFQPWATATSSGRGCLPRPTRTTSPTSRPSPRCPAPSQACVASRVTSSVTSRVTSLITSRITSRIDSSSGCIGAVFGAEGRDFIFISGTRVERVIFISGDVI